jgi:hypothetical protein
MGVLVVAEGELDTEVLFQERNLVDGGNQGLVNGLLVRLALSINGLLLLLLQTGKTPGSEYSKRSSVNFSYLGLLTSLLLLLAKEGSGGLLVLLLLGLGEELVIDLGGVDASDIDLLRGGDDVSLVHTPQRYTVDAEGTWRGESDKNHNF